MNNTIENYIDQRLHNQQEYFSNKAGANKRKYTRFQIAIIVIGAIIPLLVVMDQTELFGAKGWSGLVTAILSACISIIAGLDKLNQPQTEWVNNRATSELLKQEEYLYKYQAGPYASSNSDEADILFVERVESIISADVATFVQSRKENKKHAVEESSINESKSKNNQKVISKKSSEKLSCDEEPTENMPVGNPPNAEEDFNDPQANG